MTPRTPPLAFSTDAKTSKRMAGIRQADTAPELLVRAALRQAGLRYRIRNRDLPGSPDVANRSARWAVFVHGCYWHRHDGCPRSTTPKRNGDLWRAKFDANVARDARAMESLRERGCRVLVVWECEAEDERRLGHLVREFAADVASTSAER